jgi:hypothetical protein
VFPRREGFRFWGAHLAQRVTLCLDLMRGVARGPTPIFGIRAPYRLAAIS